MWGTDSRKQEYYQGGREIREISRRDIAVYCQACGFITLNGTNDFENRNGGLTVKRSEVVIYDAEGGIVQALRPKKRDFIKVWGCNACVNDWK
ncbi:MAG: hypothetical protein JXB42_10435 [Deltaproteobacteria bacterium]|nr:hypothetical protein [Deltaproteobacteria bacterium]